MTRTIDRWNEVKTLAEEHGFLLVQENSGYELWHAGVKIHFTLSLTGMENWIEREGK